MGVRQRLCVQGHEIIRLNFRKKSVILKWRMDWWSYGVVEVVILRMITVEKSLRKLLQ